MFAFICAVLKHPIPLAGTVFAEIPFTSCTSNDADVC